MQARRSGEAARARVAICVSRVLLDGPLLVVYDQHCHVSLF